MEWIKVEKRGSCVWTVCAHEGFTDVGGEEATSVVMPKRETELRKRDESRSVRGGGKRKRSKKTPFDESERGGRREVIGWGNIDFVS